MTTHKRKCCECGSYRETDCRPGYDGECWIEEEFDHDPDAFIHGVPCNGSDDECLCWWDPEERIQIREWVAEGEEQ